MVSSDTLCGMQIVAVVLLLAYVITTEALDWIGRAEIIENRWPRAWLVMSNRPARVILVLVAIGLLVHVITEKREPKQPALIPLPTPSPAIPVSPLPVPSPITTATPISFDCPAEGIELKQQYHADPKNKKEDLTSWLNRQIRERGLPCSITQPRNQQVSKRKGTPKANPAPTPMPDLPVLVNIVGGKNIDVSHVEGGKVNMDGVDGGTVSHVGDKTIVTPTPTPLIMRPK